MGEYDQKMVQQQTLSLNFRSYSPLTVCRCDDIYFIFNFRLYSPVKVRHCGDIYYILGHVHHIKVRGCQVFGHVHKFWSYSFGHLYSVMLTTLRG